MSKTDYLIIEQRKIKLITMITQLYDLDLLESIEKLLIKKKDWWQSISEAEQQAIDIGLEDIKNGNLISHQEVMQEVEKQYKDM